MMWTQRTSTKAKAYSIYLFIGSLSLQCIATPSALAALSLDQAIAVAQQNDPWISGSEQRQRAFEAESMAANTLPDPMLSMDLANMPVDTFDFDQEAMTQLKVGVTQVIPRGDILALNQQRLALMGAQQPHQRDVRKATVAVNVSHLWLDAFAATESIRLIEQDRELFEHLVDVAQSSYSSGAGKSRQQDLIRAQLELTRLEDRLSVLHERLDVATSRLQEWLPAYTSGGNISYEAGSFPSLDLSGQLPDIALRQPQFYSAAQQPSMQDIAQALTTHPAIRTLDTKILASDSGIKIAQQKYKPEWKLNASYGYRDDAPDGIDRSDFFSVGVAVDLPLFTSNRQDQQVQSAIAASEATRTERALALRNMVAAFDSKRSKLLRLEQRRELYRARLLREMHEQAEASLTAYAHDDGDFSEVVRARIAELNAQIDALDIEVERQKTIAQLNYFFAASETKSGEQI